MYTKNNKTYSDAFKYLSSTKYKGIGFTMTDSPDTLEEKDIDMNNITHDTEFIHFGILGIKCKDFTHKGIKLAVIESRYSNDDQIAIILNNEEESVKRMQEWRDFAEQIAGKLSSE
jgi:hypothetical protein